MFIDIWLPVWGPEASAGQVACVAGGFLVCFLFCGSQSARKLNRGRNRKRWFSFGAAESVTLRKKKHTKKKNRPGFAGYRTSDLTFILQA